MARGWFGLCILIVFLVLGIVVSVTMHHTHEPAWNLLNQAADLTLAGNFDRAVPLAMAAKDRWETAWNGTAVVADHSPMDEIDRLFAEASVCDPDTFAACCAQLRVLVAGMAQAHAFSWRNIL